MGERNGLENNKPKAEIDEPLVLQILESIRRDREFRQSKEQPGSSANRASLPIEMQKVKEYANELSKLTQMRPGNAITVTDETGAQKESTVHDRLRQLEPLIDKQFQQTIALASSVDRTAAAELLSKVKTALFEQRQDLTKLGQTPDLLQAAARQGDETRQANAEGNPLATLSYAGLQLLGWHLEQAISSPQVLRLQYAYHLSEKGDFAKAYEQIVISDPLNTDQDDILCRLRQYLSQQLRRQELAGGDDPLTLSLRAQNRALCADMDGYFALTNQAERSAKQLDYEQIKRQIGEIKSQLKSESLTEDRRRELVTDLNCLEDLSHSKASVEFAKILPAARAGDFAAVKKTVDGIIASDPEYAADRSTDLLSALYFANTCGEASSIWQFNQHLVQFQRSLSPQDFNLESAQKQLDAAFREADKLPVEAIEAIRATKLKELDRLGRESAVENDPNQREKLRQQQAELTLTIDGLNLLAHGPSYCKLMQGVFELANRNNNAALEIFDDLGRDDPEFTAQSHNQIEQLKKIAKLRIEAPEAEDRLRELMIDLVSSSVAMLAAAITVTGTAATGPGALIAGALVGSATKTFVRGVMGESIRWHDPVLGAVDGLAGSAAVLSRAATMSRLANSGRSIAAADRALAAVELSPAALEGLSGVERLEQARRLSGQALKSLDLSMPWYAQLGNRLPFLANSEYAIASKAYSGLVRQATSCAVKADLAAYTTAAAIRHGGRYAPQLLNGQSDSYGDLAAKYLGAVASDVGSSYVFGSLQYPLCPAFLNKYMWIGAAGWNDLHAIRPTSAELANIERILERIRAPKSPESISEDYFTLPGPKVDARLGQGESNGRR
jgi:hypothetical protein